MTPTVRTTSKVKRTCTLLEGTWDLTFLLKVLSNYEGLVRNKVHNDVFYDLIFYEYQIPIYYFLTRKILTLLLREAFIRKKRKYIGLLPIRGSVTQIYSNIWHRILDIRIRILNFLVTNIFNIRIRPCY